MHCLADGRWGPPLPLGRCDYNRGCILTNERNVLCRGNPRNRQQDRTIAFAFTLASCLPLSLSSSTRLARSILIAYLNPLCWPRRRQATEPHLFPFVFLSSLPDRLTAKPSYRAVVHRADLEATEIVFHVDGCLNVANLEACVDLADQFKFGDDFEDAAPVRRETSGKAYLGKVRFSRPAW